MGAQGTEWIIEGRAGGPVETVSYRVADALDGAWVLVDPTFGAAELWADRLAERPPDAIWITHAHFDHIAGLPELVRRFPRLAVWAHPDAAPLLADPLLNGASWFGFPCEPCRATHFWRDGGEAALGRLRARVIEAPGHCPGSVVLYTGSALLAGDVLFRGGVGRWDLPGADYETLAQTIRERIMTLPEETVVYPGHGPATTIGAERRRNPLVRRMLGLNDVDVE